MRHAMLTDTGNVREKNEDSMLLCEKEFGETQVLLAAVADGMGGLSYGERASRYVTDYLRRWWDEEIEGKTVPPKIDHISDMLGFVIEKMQSKLRQQAKQQHTNMGTTLSLIFIVGESYIIKQVGDSRIYLLSGKHCCQITKDQTWCQQEVDAGRMDAAQALVHEKRHVLTNALGVGEGFFVQGISGQLYKRQRVLLCSDGYYTYLQPEELYRHFGRSLKRSLECSGERIKRGRAEDNYTAILIEL